MNNIALKNARVELKTTARTKEMLSTAASLSGQDLTAFMLSCAEERAKTVLAEYHALSLSEQEQVNFMEAFTKPSQPTKALKELMSVEDLVER